MSKCFDEFTLGLLAIVCTVLVNFVVSTVYCTFSLWHTQRIDYIRSSSLVER